MHASDWARHGRDLCLSPSIIPSSPAAGEEAQKRASSDQQRRPDIACAARVPLLSRDAPWWGCLLVECRALHGGVEWSEQPGDGRHDVRLVKR